jgi:hypothetical protein
MDVTMDDIATFDRDADLVQDAAAPQRLTRLAADRFENRRPAAFGNPRQSSLAASMLGARAHCTRHRSVHAIWEER